MSSTVGQRGGRLVINGDGTLSVRVNSHVYPITADTNGFSKVLGLTNSCAVVVQIAWTVSGEAYVGAVLSHNPVTPA